MKKVTSPNTVIAKYISDTIDILRPKIEIKKPKEIVFYIGTNINGVPHLATALVHSIGFLFAEKVQSKFKIPCRIKIGIHDNISFESKLNGEGVVYHKTYFHSQGQKEIENIIQEYYIEYFDKLSALTGLAYDVESYSEAQKRPGFRKAFLKTLTNKEATGWAVSPSTGVLQIRTPCPTCQFSDRDSKTTQFKFKANQLEIVGLCPEHGEYTVQIKEDNESYLDLSTLYRNLVKEVETLDDPERMYVMVKGGDWIYSTSTINLAFGAMGYTALDTPARIFTPQLVTSTGAKLSKSLILLGDESMKEAPEWMLDLSKFKDHFGVEYLDKIVELTQEFFRDPRNMYRTYTIKEIIRLLS
ncbi:MAG: hypothetical protein AAB821_02665 [Patescibacteria group bacterium]